MHGILSHQTEITELPERYQCIQTAAVLISIIQSASSFQASLLYKMFPSTSLANLHPDIIHTNVLSRFDGQTLASVSCASSQLHSLSEDETLWTNICHATWPSTSHPLMRQAISGCPNGPRSFFADSYPYPVPITHQPTLSTSPSEIISAVDMHYKNKLIFSKVQQTKTNFRLFRCSPFRIDCLQPGNVVRMPVQLKTGSWKNLLDDLTLSWIVVIGQRAANLSSCRTVSVERHRLTKDVRVTFATIFSLEQESYVMCEIVVTLEGDIELSEVSIHLEDIDGINLKGQHTMEIFQNAIEWGSRRKCAVQERLKVYREYVKKKEGLRKHKTLALPWAYLPTIFQ